MVSEQELIILGLLKEGPKHGYEIKNELKQIGGIFAGLDTESIYYPLKIIEKKGLATKRISRVGKRPEKYTYYITAKGDVRFLELLKKSFVTIDRPRFDIDISLYFLPYLNHEDIRHKLTVRLRILKKIKSGLVNLRESGDIKLHHHLAIINHNIELIEAEIHFLADFIGNPQYFSLMREK